MTAENAPAVNPVGAFLVLREDTAENILRLLFILLPI